MPMSPNRKFITESCKDIEKLYELVSSFCATSKANLIMYRRIGSNWKYRRILTAWKNNIKLELTPRGSEQFKIVYTDYGECIEKRISKYVKS